MYPFAKRLLDLAFVLGIAVFFGWLLVLVWIAVKLTSPGPGIFAQPRVGQHGRIFTCYKFRTMQQGVKIAGTHELSADAITKVGHFLRRTRIDELPQIVNILRNEMSLIGPRPCLPMQEELVKWRTELGALSVKPGLSGLAQVNGVDMSDPERLARMDAEYVARRSLALDMKLILATVRGKGMHDYVQKS